MGANENGPRPKRCRRIGLFPNCAYLKPTGVPRRTLAEVVLAMDELEAVRQPDVKGPYQQQAADQKGVWRRTFGRIIDSARAKVTGTSIEGKTLRNIRLGQGLQSSEIPGLPLVVELRVSDRVPT